MSVHNITVEGGTSVKLLVSGKYCDRDIVVTATGGSGGSTNLPNGHTQVACVQFSGDQIIDTGVICTQNTKIKVVFTRESSSSLYMYGVVNSGNTASVTAYLASGGSWRFGNKSASKTITVNEDLVHTAIVSNTGIIMAGSTSSFSSVNAFETVGSLLIGACRSATGTVGAAQFVGKILAFDIWQSGELVLNLVPAVNSEGIYGLFDKVSEEFYTSITDTDLTGGDI